MGLVIHNSNGIFMYEKVVKYLKNSPDIGLTYFSNYEQPNSREIRNTNVNEQQ